MRVQFACLLLLSATALSEDAHFERFKEHHIYEKESDPDCDTEIRESKIAYPNNKCKKNNTFIRAPPDRVKDICRNGEPYDGMTKSRQHFKIVVCTLTNQGASHPHCKHSVETLTKTILIKCEQGFPVHFEKHLED
ncbi:hypothetical protein ABVT39_017333 [Epinephelus coioides]